jgi:hypothetical protein
MKLSLFNLDQLAARVVQLNQNYELRPVDRATYGKLGKHKMLVTKAGTTFEYSPTNRPLVTNSRTNDDVTRTVTVPPQVEAVVELNANDGFVLGGLVVKVED